MIPYSSAALQSDCAAIRATIAGITQLENVFMKFPTLDSPGNGLLSAFRQEANREHLAFKHFSAKLWLET